MTRMYATTLASAVLSLSLSCLGATEVYAGQFLKISDDLQLYYEDRGSGSPIVLIPGWTASQVVFEHQIDHFAQTHRVIAYDPRSQGFSSQTIDHNTYSQHGRDLAALIEKLGLKHVTLIAWSAACFDAYSYIRAFDIDNLAALVCIDNPAQGLSASPGDWALVQADGKSLADMHDLREKLMSDQRGVAESFFKFMNARDVTPEESDWFIRQFLLCPPYAALLLQAD